MGARELQFESNTVGPGGCITRRTIAGRQLPLR